ncbi:ABC transporter permease [Variovorax sp. J22R133]|nr:ABC transporter permease [Variovorax sp. J22R133]MDM0116375.1 ABC transporter permease [Variovorax sp. J22R133]
MRLFESSLRSESIAKWPSDRSLARPAAFLGNLLISGSAALGGQWQFRARDFVRILADCSAKARVIVVVVNSLVGAILTFVGAVQLAKFGTGIFVADLVGIAVAREMAAIITAVVIAGRPARPSQRNWPPCRRTRRSMHSKCLA